MIVLLVVVVSLVALVAVGGNVALRGNGISVCEQRFSWEDERKEPLERPTRPKRVKRTRKQGAGHDKVRQRAIDTRRD